MPIRKEALFEPGRPYHILSRAVEGREIFGTPEDSARFIFQMYAANIGSPAVNLYRTDVMDAAKAILEGKDVSEKMINVEHPPLVEFFSFALVGNHYHFGLVPTSEDSISRYMQKLNISFAKYYNLKNNRRGALFETRFKAVPIKTPEQLDLVVRYINVKNVLDMFQPGWQEKGLSNEEDAMQFLRKYPYSSFPDLFDQRRSLIISPSGRSELKKFVDERIFEGREAYLQFFKEYIESKTDLFKHLYLE